jgi:CRISPR/Cas system-associated endonuclease Cas1
LEHELLDEYAKNVEKNDVTNREGHAAKVYFNSLFGKDFNRRDEENETNHVLNYLYSLILSIFNRVLVEYGYNTQLGI